MSEEAEPVNLYGSFFDNGHHDRRWDVHEDRQYNDHSMIDFMPVGEAEFRLPINLNEEADPVNLNGQAEPVNLYGDFFGHNRHHDRRWDVHEDRQWGEHGWGDG